MTRILCIESSTEVCSVAIAIDGAVADFEESTEGVNHSKLLTLFVKRLMERNSLSIKDFDAVAVSKGPGSYTGLRIGVSAAKGFCYAADIPMIAVCPLQSMAMKAISLQEDRLPSDYFIPMIDARRMEVYTATFDASGISVSDVEAKIIDEKSFVEKLVDHRCFYFGNGASKCRNILSGGTDTVSQPNDSRLENLIFVDGIIASARNVSSLAYDKFQKSEFVDTAYFEPFYLKDFKATTPKNSVLGTLVDNKKLLND